VHQNLHAEERPHCCDVCNKTFVMLLLERYNMCNKVYVQQVI
jgi:hypothetical protein